MCQFTICKIRKTIDTFQGHTKHVDIKKYVHEKPHEIRKWNKNQTISTVTKLF